VDNALAAQLVTVGATLGGVVLTMVGSAFVERRRAREAHRLEALRLTAQHTTWLRAERTTAYAAFSLAAEEVQQFLRNEVPVDGADLSARWRELRTVLRTAYNQVCLFGADEPIAASLLVWRTARNGGNDLLSGKWADLAGEAKDTAGRLGAEINDFLTACRADLQRN
jgi:hypothetical protein